jgi:alkylhydroperoxidase family enzyme
VADAGFLSEPAADAAVEAMYDADRASDGYVMNLTRVWAHMPEVNDAWTALAHASSTAAGLTFRQKGILVSALAAELGDAYCSYAWGTRLARASDDGTAAAVLSGDRADALDDAEHALADWARQLVRDPNGTTPEHIAGLRAIGLDDRAIAALTAYVAARIAFSTVNDALGAAPDAELHASAPDAVRAAIAWGRPPAGDVPG